MIEREREVGGSLCDRSKRSLSGARETLPTKEDREQAGTDGRVQIPCSSTEASASPSSVALQRFPTGATPFYPHTDQS